MPDDLIVVPEPPQTVSLGVVHGDLPAELLKRATDAANVLADLIKSKKLYSTIQGKEYVRVEGWTTLAVMLGCLPRESGITRREDGTYEASVELVRIADGIVLTRASAECGIDEPKWAKGPDYARRSMAATRATSKACRLAFSWVMVLAGFQPTPAEEMISVVEERKPRQALSEAPSALDEPDTPEAFDETDPGTGEILEVLSEAQTIDLRALVKSAGVSGKDWPAFYQQATGKDYTGKIYLADRKALATAAAKLLARRKAS